MSYQWRDLIGALAGGKYKLTDLLDDMGAEAVFATDAIEAPAIARIALADTLPDNWAQAAKVDHPHVIRTFSAGVEDIGGSSVAYTVTERPDDSLAEALQGRALSEEEAHEAVTGILDALVELHARGLAHGAVEPANIVAVGEEVKLSPWSIHRAGAEAASGDIFALGQTIVEVLTQKRPATLAEASSVGVPGVLGQVAKACLQRRYSAKQALDALEGREETAVPAAPPAPVMPTFAAQAPPPSSGMSKGALTAIALGILVAIGGMQWFRSGTTVEAPAQQTTEVAQAPPPVPAPEAARERTEPVPPPVRAPAVQAPAQAAAPATEASPSGNWAVVAATYNSHGLAERRSRQIEAKWKSWDVEVYPAEGSGKHYLVVLGYGKDQREAQQLLAKARAEGLPRDTYVTKLTR